MGLWAQSRAQPWAQVLKRHFKHVLCTPLLENSVHTRSPHALLDQHVSAHACVYCALTDDRTNNFRYVNSNAGFKPKVN